MRASNRGSSPTFWSYRHPGSIGRRLRLPAGSGGAAPRTAFSRAGLRSRREAVSRRPTDLGRRIDEKVCGILRALALVTLAAASVGACAVQPTGSIEGSSPVDGIVVSIDARSLTDVRGFSLRTSGTGTLEFKLGPLENATSFPPGHLAEHQATSLPVRVYFRVENGARVVYRLEDAAPPSAAPSSAAT